MNYRHLTIFLFWQHQLITFGRYIFPGTYPHPYSQNLQLLNLLKFQIEPKKGIERVKNPAILYNNNVGHRRLAVFVYWYYQLITYGRYIFHGTYPNPCSQNREIFQRLNLLQSQIEPKKQKGKERVKNPEILKNSPVNYRRLTVFLYWQY